MKPGSGSSGKGAKFMREVCITFSRWHDPSLPEKVTQEDLTFRVRSTSIQPVEGHWHGRGDILCRPNVPWPFTTECKKHEGWELDGMLSNDKWPVWAWWAQTKAQAADDEGVPLLVFSRNRRKNFILIEEADALCLRLHPRSGPLVRVQKPNEGVLVLARLDDLVQLPFRNARRLRRPSSRATRSSSS